MIYLTFFHQISTVTCLEMYAYLFFLFLYANAILVSAGNVFLTIVVVSHYRHLPLIFVRSTSTYRGC